MNEKQKELTIKIAFLMACSFFVGMIMGSPSEVTESKYSDSQIRRVFQVDSEAMLIAADYVELCAESYKAISISDNERLVEIVNEMAEKNAELEELTVKRINLVEEIGL